MTFALTGALVGVFTGRIPALIDRMAISTAELGPVLFAWGLGAVLTMQALRPVMARAGSASVLRAATPLSAVSVALVAWAPTYLSLLLAVTVFGGAYGAVEIGAKAQGSAVERAYGRPLMGGMNAGWPVGAGVGGLSAAACAHLGVSYSWSLAGVALIALPLAIALGRMSIDRPPGAAVTFSPVRPRIRPIVYLCGLLAFAALVLEGAITDWSGVLLHYDLGSSQQVAALSYPLFQAGVLTGLLVVDPLRARLGDRTVIAGAGLATATALLAAATQARPGLVLAGAYAVGVSISPLLPLAFSLAGAGDRGVDDAAIAQVGAVGHAGLLVGPPMVGALAHATTLSTALAALGVVLGSIVLSAGLMLPRTPRADSRVRVTARGG